MDDGQPGAERAQSSVVEVRRYPNRRLYDTRESRYVALEEIAATIRDGHQVRVVDAKSGADVTREVLLALLVQLVEREGAGSVLTPSALHRLIRAVPLAASDSMRATLRWMLDRLLDAAAGRARALPAAEALRRASRTARTEAANGAAANAAGASERDESVAARFEQLERRVGALEAALRARPGAGGGERGG